MVALRRAARARVASARLCASVWCSSRIVEPSFVMNGSAADTELTSIRVRPGLGQAGEQRIQQLALVQHGVRAGLG